MGKQKYQSFHLFMHTDLLYITAKYEIIKILKKDNIIQVTAQKQNLTMLEDLKNTMTVFITKTNLYNVDPLKPHFYIVKLGFTGVYIILLISAQNIDCGYSLEPPRLTSTHILCFRQKI